RYQTLLDEGLITPDQYAAAVKSLTDELTGTTAAMELWVGMIEAARSPLDVITDKMDQLDADLVAGKINIDLYRQAMELLTGEMAKAADAATQASPGYKDAEAIRGELERAATEALSPAARLAKEQERVKALVDGGNLGDIEATEWLMLYKKRLDDAAGSMGLLAASERLLDDVQSGRIKTWGDMKRAFGEMLIDMVRNYMAAQTQMQGGGFLDFVMGAGKGFLGSFFGGGAGAGNPVPGAAHANIGTSHTGALGSNPLQTRRLGSGGLGNERLQYIREDEEVLTAYGKMNIAAQLGQLASERAAMSGLVSRALMGAGGGQGGPMKMIINNYAGAEVEATQR
ncbi:MAG: hypothetical protein Q8K46_02395, partial [Deltaproteobacteria bacterium]|nr:hypothetical protein [Deltaproteobacteria bacterium]